MNKLRSATLISTDLLMFPMYSALHSSSPLKSWPPARVNRLSNKASDMYRPVKDQICDEIHCQSKLGNVATFNVASLAHGIKPFSASAKSNISL